MMVAFNSHPEEKKQFKLDDFGYTNIPGTPHPPPLERPPFTLKQIRDAIPPHCFERSALKSFKYLTKDLLTCLALFYVSTFISHMPSYISFLLWPIYWILQGLYMSGLWVIGHECGHQAFSSHKIINDTVGLIVHSLLLVPYHNWKITHARHHMHTASMEDDEVYVPTPRAQLEQTTKIGLKFKTALGIGAKPFQTFIATVVMLLFGFIPLYLILNLTGPKKYEKKNASHFSTSSVLFSPKQYNDIVVSNCGVFIVFVSILWACMNYGFMNVFFYYVIPYMFVNMGLVLVTFLHHTDTYLPHFRGEEWTWLRGALSTVDRSLGCWWLNEVSHHISITHVCHHLFPQMPFYHTVEATKAMRKVLGPYYMRDRTPILQALARAYKKCKFVEDEGTIVFYKNSLQ